MLPSDIYKSYDPETNISSDKFNHWIAIKMSLLENSQKTRKELKPNINEFRIFLKSVLELQKQFKESLILLKSVTYQSEKQAMKSKLLNIKEHMEILHEILNNELYVGALIKKLYKIKKRREYLIRKKENQITAEVSKKHRIEELDIITEQWLIEKREHDANKRMKKNEKQKTKLILSDVVNRITQINEKIELIDSLKQLRNLKMKRSLENRTATQPDDSDAFDTEVGAIRDLLVSKLAEHNDEKTNLLEQLSLAADPSKIGKSKRLQLAIQENVNSMLFGDEDRNSLSSKCDYFFKQASLDFFNFVDIRLQWDNYCVSDDRQSGSYLPITWPLPDQPNHESWHRFLQ